MAEKPARWLLKCQSLYWPCDVTAIKKNVGLGVSIAGLALFLCLGNLLHILDAHSASLGLNLFL